MQRKSSMAMATEAGKGSNPFELFCWYYLGLSPQGDYKFINGNQVAKIYNWSVDDLMETLRRHKIDPDTVVNTDFPLSKYQIDIQIAAENRSGDLLLEFATRIFNEFSASVGNSRDWLAEIAREKEEDRYR